MAKKKLTGRARRKVRVRQSISGSAARPRLNVFRSAKHVYAQLIDDEAGVTLSAASSLKLGGGNKTALAEQVGTQLAQSAQEKNIAAVVFDRNGYRFHGRVRAVAEAARAGGLKF